MTNSQPSSRLQSAPPSATADSDFDCLVIGSGFSGSLISGILQSQGKRVAIIDRSSHPRFAIGESSTPAASLILSSLADQYDLHWLKPFARYGTWRHSYPQITTGRKRGFSYFQHEAGKPFLPDKDHSNELLAAASSSDELSDTQWLRSEVDTFFFEKACEAGVTPYENSEITTLHRRRSGWVVKFNETTPQTGMQSRTLSAQFLIDASGTGQVLARHLRIADESDVLATNSRAIFAHVIGLSGWAATLESVSRGSTVDHPFSSDDAAQHHLLDEGWMWRLRFDSGVTSVGLVLDARNTGNADHNRDFDHRNSTDEFQSIVNRYPSLRDAFSDITLTNPRLMPVRTQRLQRLSRAAAGKGWAMLPHTAGFIDPLHSTGIAHSLAGVERLAGVLLSRNNDVSDRTLDANLQNYSSTIRKELILIDQLVAGCYDAIALRSFRKFAAFTMCYFAAATTWEHRRLQHETDPRLRASKLTAVFRPALLCADVTEFRASVYNLRVQMPEETDESFELLCRETLTPFNHVGLFEPPIQNIYGATAFPLPSSTWG